MTINNIFIIHILGFYQSIMYNNYQYINILGSINQYAMITNILYTNDAYIIEQYIFIACCRSMNIIGY